MNDVDKIKNSDLSNDHDNSNREISLTNEEMEVFRSIVEKNPEEAANIFKNEINLYRFPILVPLWVHSHHLHRLKVMVK